MKSFRFEWFFVGISVLLFSFSSSWAAENTIPNITFGANNSNEEVDRILFVFRNINFFEKNNYNVCLPSHPYVVNLKKEAMNRELSAEEIVELKAVLKKEIYNSEQYQYGLAKLRASKEKVVKCFPVFLEYQKKWGFKVFPEYKIKLTLYGVSGTYDYNNGEATIKMYENGEFKKDPAETIVHELVHVGIEEAIIQKYKLSHWIKDRIVDQFMFKHFREAFPDYKLDARGNATIDPYLLHPDSWERLPDYVAEYAKSVK